MFETLLSIHGFIIWYSSFKIKLKIFIFLYEFRYNASNLHSSNNKVQFSIYCTLSHFHFYICSANLVKQLYLTVRNYYIGRRIITVWMLKFLLTFRRYSAMLLNFTAFSSQGEQENQNNVYLTSYWPNLCHFVVMIKISISDDL